MPDFQRKLELIKNGLKSFDFYISDKSLLTLDDTIDSEIFDKRQALFLGVYSEEYILNALTKFHITEKLKEKNISDIIVKLNIKDPFHQEVCYYDKTISPETNFAHFIAREGRIHNKIENIPEEFANKSYEVVIIDWLCMQNPYENFSDSKPKLPGQKHPGLGIAKDVLKLIKAMSKRIKKDGLLDFPEFYHNARLYSYEFKFYNPRTEGSFQRMMHDLESEKRSVSDISYAIFADSLINKNTGEYFKWYREEQLLPQSEKLINYYNSQWYKEEEQLAYETHSFTIDWDKFENLKKTKDLYSLA